VQRIVVVDLDDRSYDVIYEGDDVGTAFWTAEGDRVLLVRTSADAQSITSLDPQDPSGSIPLASLPPGFFVLSGP
jgi:hypothetical protein